MERLPIREQAIYSSLGLSEAEIGPVIGTGSQFLVRRYEESNVVKISRSMVRCSYIELLHQMFGGQSLKDVQQDVHLIEKYFEPYATKTDIISNAEGQFVCIQPEIHFERITVEKMNTSFSVRQQLLDVMERNRAMIHTEGRWLDCMGYDSKRLAVFASPEGTPYFDNLVFDIDAQQVRILDGTYSIQNVLPYLVQYENARRYNLDFGEPSVRQLLGC